MEYTMRSVLKLGKPWEKTVFFSLGVVLGGRVLHTAGVTARDPEGKLVGAGDMVKQTQQCFDNLADILAAAGTGFEHVAKYTIFTTDIQRFHLETLETRAPYFRGNPAATLVEVSRLIHADMLVEIEAIVHVPGGAAE
jgi:2-iminobutanoate/2-iminopropanoate deaminase